MPAILKQHYEKIGLAIFVLALLGVLFLSTTRLRREDKERQEVARLAESSLQTGEDSQITVEESEWDVMSVLESEEGLWQDVDGGSGKQNNLFWPGRVIVCASSDCFYLIPAGMDACPFCGTKQDDTGGEEDTGPSARADTDGDGIPNGVEERMSFLNPERAADAARDEDGDTFTNIEEYEAGTDMQDPASHPLLARKLRIIGTQASYFPIRFVNIITTTPEDKENWDLFFAVRGKDNMVHCNLGDTVKVPQTGSEYRVVEVEKKMEKKFDSSVNAKVNVDVSEVELRQMKGDETIVLTRGRRGKPTGRQIKFVRIVPDESDPRQWPRHSISKNQGLVIRDKAGQRERYTLDRVSGEGRDLTVVLRHEATGSTVTVERFDPQEDIPQMRVESREMPGMPDEAWDVGRP